MAVKIHLEDVYDRVQFKLLMDLLMQYGVWNQPGTNPVTCRSTPGKRLW